MKISMICCSVALLAGGAAAGELDLGAMVKPVPLTAKMLDPDFNIWCGAPIKAEDGKYHLFYSRWPRTLGHHAWVTHCEIAHAGGGVAAGAVETQ